MLRRVGEAYEYLTFDDPYLLRQAKEDPALFFQDHPGKLILDEIQYAPELYPHLKMRIDGMRYEALRQNRPQECLFLLSGSQAYPLMQNVSESLAGRLAILPLQGISYRERKGIRCSIPFAPTASFLEERGRESVAVDDLWPMIHRGSLPELVASNGDWETFHASYVTTYIERDVHPLSRIESRGDFIRFMASVAARSGELLNLDGIARDIGVSGPTAKRWLQILETSGIVLPIRSFHNNHLKRMIKTPKVYFLDTGLMAWLTRWITPETIRQGAKAGQFFETWVVSEIAKSFLNAGRSTSDLSFYRDADQREIDLVIEDGRTLHPVEIKLSAKPDKTMAKAFRLLAPVAEVGDLQLGDSAVIDSYPTPMLLGEGVRSIPVGYL